MDIHEQHDKVLKGIIADYAEQAVGKTGSELLAIRRAEIEALMSACADIKRVLDYQSGQPIEPKTHMGEAVLLPAGGLG